VPAWASAFSPFRTNLADFCDTHDALSNRTVVLLRILFDPQASVTDITSPSLRNTTRSIGKWAAASLVDKAATTSLLSADNHYISNWFNDPYANTGWIQARSWR